MMNSNSESNGSNNSNMDQKNAQYKQGDDEDRKLFLGGLSWDTNEEDIKSYFKKFGNVLDVSVKYDAVSGQPRGFGFLTFADESSIDKVIASSPHTIKNKVIDPKRAKSRPICKKVFVGGVDANISEDDIKKYFSRYGKVEGIELPYDRQKGRRREFCFIIFDTEENADKACKESKQTIGNRECDIKKAQPQPVAQAAKRAQQTTNNNSGGHASYNGLLSGNYNSDDYTKKRASTFGSNSQGYNGTVGYGYSGANQGLYNNYYPYSQGYEQYYQQQMQQGQQPQAAQQAQAYAIGGYQDYWNYAYQTGAYGEANQSTDYANPVASGDQAYPMGNAGSVSGHSSQSSSHSAHHGSGKVSRKQAPSASNHPYHHPYRTASSH